MAGAASLWAYSRTWRSLTRLVGRPPTAEACAAIIRQRMATREERFLQFADRFIYGYPHSPYLALLRSAGCEYGDLAVDIRKRGLEPTLETLRDAGVYVTFEEFKGRADVVRGAQRFRFSEEAFDNPLQPQSLERRTGSGRRRGPRVHVALDFIADRAPTYQVMLDAVGAAGAPIILWLPGPSSGGGLQQWLTLAHLGHPPLRWLCTTDPNTPAVTPRHRMLMVAARLLARRRGFDLPEPEFTPPAAPEGVLEALLAARRRHRNCVVSTTSSGAVRVAGLARSQNVSLHDVSFIVGGEPLTPGKAQAIRGAGATVGARYSIREVGHVGRPCGSPMAPDDMHFMADCYGMILHRRPAAGLGDVQAFMFTSLRDSAPKVLLNVESDDFGEFTVRRCGCAFDDLGLYGHFAWVRSRTKLTGEGATVLGTDCIRILEEELPREFGGRSVDYQLLEAEDVDHLTRLYLVVSPEVGSVDERRLLNRFVHHLRLTRRRDALSGLWTQAGTIRVIRRNPVATSGKLLPFHTQALKAFSRDHKSTTP